MTVTDHGPWPLPDDLTAPAAARALVRAFLEQTPGATHSIGDEAELVVSELVTNAVRHGRPPVALTLEHNDGTIRIAVSNADTGALPVVRNTDDLASGGRGLAMVDAVSSRLAWAVENARLVVRADLTI